MGIYFQPGAGPFASVIADGKYVDKTGMLAYINSTLGAMSSKLLCVVRPRRFGKSYAAAMVTSYYDNSADTKYLYDSLQIAQDPSYEKHINKYHMISFSVSDFCGDMSGQKVLDEKKNEYRPATVDDIVLLMDQSLRAELLDVYPNAGDQNSSLVNILYNIFTETGVPFYFVIDEWDTLYREYPGKLHLQAKYAMFLRKLFKSSFTRKGVIGAYVTGILPMKRLGIGTAATDFFEVSMLSPYPLQEYFGFTEAEARQAITGTTISYEDLAEWYDGYLLENLHIFNPVSVCQAVKKRSLGSHWSKTEAYESLRQYIDLNFEGLRDALKELLRGETITVSYANFPNDLKSIQTRNDVITLLIHLGYLTYNRTTERVSIPNLELYKQFQDSLEKSKEFQDLYQKLKDSDNLLRAIEQGDSDTVADLIQKSHRACSPHRMYNNHEALKSTIREALITSVNHYKRVEEIPAGNGIADILYFPKPFSDKPALLVELKWNRSAASAIQQVLDKEYPEALRGFCGKIQLVGVSYHPKSKKHTCMIQTYTIE